MLEALISSRTRVKLLTLFLLNPEREYYVREIARTTGENINAVRRELANLESFGLISSERRGNQIHYMVDRNFFLYDELQRIVLKTEGIAAMLEQRLGDLGTVECIFIYGSFAAGKAGKRSDIDLCIVGNVDEDRLVSIIHESEQILGREINYTLLPNKEFRDRLARGDPFLSNIMKEPKIVIRGTCDD